MENSQQPNEEHNPSPQPTEPTPQPQPIQEQPVNTVEPSVTQPQVLQQAPYQVAGQTIVSSSDMQKHGTKKKKLILASIFLAIICIASVVVAYALLIYIPNKPENVFKKAMANFTQDPSGYSISGKLDQGGPNDPDYNYTINTDQDGNSYARVDVSTFLQRPSVSVQKIDGKLYVQFTGFEDSKKLATHYSNSGQKGIQEYIAEFTDKASLTATQDKWLEVGNYFTQQPNQTTNSASTQTELTGATLSSVGSRETVNGKATRKYEVTLSSDAFRKMAGQFDSAASAPVLSGIFPKGGISTDQINITVWVNTKSKTIEQISYDGRPFSDATFSFKYVATENKIDKPQAEKATSKLGYGIVSTQVFNKQFQQGDSVADKERLADLKGIKTALEIYKARTGHYPERYEMSVTQESLITNQMRGADIDIFKDPNGRLIGRNGSQYAYVPALSNDSQDCGKSSKPCEKYFVVTTLDNGQQFQLNSD